MIRCLKRPEHLVIRIEIKKWLAYSDMQANKVIYLAQQREAIKQVKIAFEYLREDKMAIFLSNKSYFKCKIEGLAFLAKDNKEYVVISSNKEEEQTILGAYLVFYCSGRVINIGGTNVAGC